MKTKPSKFDAAEYLDSKEAIAAYLEAVLDEEGVTPTTVTKALGIVVRAHGITQLAGKIGMSREGLSKALSDSGNPEFGTVLKIIQGLGVRLSVAPGAKRGKTTAKAKKKAA